MPNNYCPKCGCPGDRAHHIGCPIPLSSMPTPDSPKSETKVTLNGKRVITDWKSAKVVTDSPKSSEPEEETVCMSDCNICSKKCANRLCPNEEDLVSPKEKVKKILNELWIIDDNKNCIPADGIPLYTNKIIRILDQAYANGKRDGRKESVKEVVELIESFKLSKGGVTEIQRNAYNQALDDLLAQLKEEK